MDADLAWRAAMAVACALKDVACYAVFARRLARAGDAGYRRRLACALLVAAAAQAAFTWLFGHDGVVGMFIVVRGIVQVAFQVGLYLVVGVIGLRLTPKAALAWSMVFAAGVQAGEKAFVFVARAPLAALVVAPHVQDLLQLAVIAALDLAACAPLAPTPRETDDAAIGSQSIALLAFVTCDCVLLMLGEGADGPLAAWHLATNALQCVALFVCALMVKRGVGRTAAMADTAAAAALARERYARLMQRREADERIGQVYHDLRHALATFHSLDETDAIVARLDEARAAREEVAYTGNVVLNMLLNDAARTAREAGVALRVQANVGDGPIMDDVELCLVLGNAFSNAFEAVAPRATGRTPTPSGAWVSFAATELPAVVVMTVRNPCRVAPALRDGLPVTTAADPARHGIGLRSMRDTLVRRGGTLATAWRDGVFSLTIMVPRRPSPSARPAPSTCAPTPRRAGAAANRGEIEAS
ncbi:GHKL domain-containing protein [bacterium]|nr:GHKL domain-containing protein [bacterium]